MPLSLVKFRNVFKYFFPYDVFQYSPITFSSFLNHRLRLAKMNEEMRESEGLCGQPGQYSTNNHTEMQYKKCIQEFISLQLEDS